MKKLTLNEEINKIKKMMLLSESILFELFSIPIDIQNKINAKADEMVQEWESQKQAHEMFQNMLKSSYSQKKTKKERQAYQKMIAASERRGRQFNVDKKKYRENIIYNMVQQYLEYQKKYSKVSREDVLKNSQFSKETYEKIFEYVIKENDFSDGYFYTEEVPDGVKRNIDSGMSLPMACAKFVMDGGTLPLYYVLAVGKKDDDDYDVYPRKPKPTGELTMDKILDTINDIKINNVEFFEKFLLNEFDEIDALKFIYKALTGEMIDNPFPEY